jgi:putative ABC transport system permease protein
VKVGDELFIEPRFYFAEPSVFDVLTIPFVQGDAKTALSQPNAIVITESIAKKYFGTIEALGRTLTINLSQSNTDYKVTGVLRDCPANSHFKYDLLASLENYWAATNPFFRERLKGWFSLPFWTYVKLAPGADAKEVEAKLAQVVTQYFPPTRQDSRLFLQPVKYIHLRSSLDNELEPNSDIRYVYIFSAIALLVLAVACINFMNLTTAKSLHRAKEVGLRKVLGAARPQLIKQFLFESILATAAAVLIALGLIELTLDRLNALAGVALPTNYWDIRFIPAVLALTLIVGVAAGLYPAFFLSSFQPVKTVKGVFARSAQGRSVRMGLAVVQMGIAVVLLVGILTISRQLNFIQNKKLGFEKNQMLLIKTPGTKLFNNLAYETFKQRLLLLPAVAGVTKNVQIPGEGAAIRSVYFNSVTAGEKLALPYLSVGHDFAATYGLELVAGRDISSAFASDTNSVYLVNETAARQFNLDPVVGRQIATGDAGEQHGPIVGVVKDFHYAPLHEPIGPLVIGLFNVPLTNISVRLQTDRLAAAVADIQKIWREFEPDRAMEFSFLDGELEAVYRFENRLGKIAGIFAGLAIFVTGLGLFGMALYTAEQRIKEIGIRKVLGATSANVVALLSKDFVKIVLLANLFAWPVAWLAMRRWLQDFAYRVDIAWWLFGLAGGLVLVVALLTAGAQALKAALANPAKALRYE